MTNQEINEFLAEKLEGIEKLEYCCIHQKEFDQRYKSWAINEDTQCCEFCGTDATYDGSICKENEIPDYCKNTIPVLKKLLEMNVKVEIWISGETGRYNCKISHTQIQKVGDTESEAICRCAVAYLKARGTNYEH